MSAAQVALFRQTQQDVTALAYREILAFWRSLDVSEPRVAVRALEAFLPEVVQAYGEIGAAAAADFYDDLREASPGARRAYAAVMGDAVPLEAVSASTRWAAGPLFRPDGIPDGPATLGRVLAVADRFVKAQGRRTITTNVERDPARARYARVPTGTTTCGFCTVLASRGAVYTSGDDAGHKYHERCDCVPTPIWDGDALPYDVEHFEAVYRDALKRSDSGDLNAVARTIRADNAR